MKVIEIAGIFALLFFFLKEIKKNGYVLLKSLSPLNIFLKMLKYNCKEEGERKKKAPSKSKNTI